MVRDTGNYDGPGLTTAGRNGDLPATVIERHGVRSGIYSFTVESAKGRHKLRMTGNQKIGTTTAESTPPADAQPGSVAGIANTAALSQYLHDNLKVDTHLHGGKNPSDPLVVSLIVAQHKNRGDGTKAMQAITDYADALGLTVALTPDGMYGGSVPRLTEFYKRFGFAPNKGRNRDFSTRESMIRPPQPRVPSTASHQGQSASTPPGHLDLYHRTTPTAAHTIRTNKRMTSKENTGEAYFSTFKGDEPNAQATGYGAHAVHVRVPEHLADLDDEFPSGEQHYRIDTKKLKPEHFVVD